jgi:hypothetical protein
MALSATERAHRSRYPLLNVSTDSAIRYWTCPQIALSATERVYRWRYPPLNVPTDGAIRYWTCPQITLSATERVHRWPYPLLNVSTDGAIRHWTCPQIALSATERVYIWRYPPLSVSTDGAIRYWTCLQMALSATERVHRWRYPRDDPTITYPLFLPFSYVHHVKLSLYWTAVPWWSTVLEKRITSHLPKNFLHFMKPYGLLYFPKEAAAVSCAESAAPSPHIPNQCYSLGYTWAFKALPFIQVCTLKRRIHFSSLLRVPHGQTISSVIELP